MSRSSVAFPRSYQRHLVTEQRKAVLAALRDRIGPEHTVGEVLDAAEALGWAEPMGDLSLADLAAALLTPIGEGSRAAAADDDEAEDDELEESDEDVVEVEAPPQRGRTGKKKAAKATKAPVAKGKAKAAAKKASARAPEPASKKAGKKGPGKKTAAGQQNKKTQKQNKKAPSKAPVVTTARGGKGKPAISKKTGKGRRAAPVDFDEPMSLEEAAAVLVPLVRSLGEATMQDLEEQTAGGRRKLRFHIGQLVRRGYLLRHGMGRGTFYTVG